MIEKFPAEIISGNIKLVKLAPTLDNVKIVFDIVENIWIKR